MLRGIGSLARWGILFHIASAFRRHARVWLQWIVLALLFVLIEHFYGDVQDYLTLASDTAALLSALMIKIGLEFGVVFYALWLLYVTFLRHPHASNETEQSTSDSRINTSNDVVTPTDTTDMLVHSPKKRADLVREKLREQVAQKQQK